MRPRGFNLSLAAFAVMTLLAIPLSDAAPTSFPIVCSGGGTMYFQVVQSSSDATVVIYFTKAPAGASQQPPGPGQCAWLDRPISQGEPSQLRFQARLKNFTVRASGQRMSFINFDPSGARDVIQALLSGALFHVHAYNNRGFNLLVTRFGP